MNLLNIIFKTSQFINKLKASNGYKFSNRLESSPYVRCFVIFFNSSSKKFDWVKKRKQKIIYDLNNNFNQIYKRKIKNGREWENKRSFFKLYCFTLSVPNILNGLHNTENRFTINFKTLLFDRKKVQ